jgi:hypothetical protein
MQCTWLRRLAALAGLFNLGRRPPFLKWAAASFRGDDRRIDQWGRLLLPRRAPADSSRVSCSGSREPCNAVAHEPDLVLEVADRFLPGIGIEPRRGWEDEATSRAVNA